MATELPYHPCEFYLLEHFSSLAYYEPMVQSWAAMVEHLESLLERFMHKLPSGYRRRHLSEQPDIVWGNRCIPNFRSTLKYLQDGAIELRAGDLDGLTSATWVNSDVRGQREYSSKWMNEVEPGAEGRYAELLYRSSDRASIIARTAGSYWIQKSLQRRWYREGTHPPSVPEYWPEYRLDPTIQVPTDGPVEITGLYVPRQPDGSPNLLIAGIPANDACLGLNEQRIQYARKEPTVWTLVRRVADQGPLKATLPSREAATAAPSAEASRVEAGQPCPRDGWWMSPAKVGSRRYVKSGETMPSLGREYGLTIWQWDVDQSVPSLQR